MAELADRQSPPTVPDAEELMNALTAVFNTNGSARGRLAVVRREPSPYSTTFPCEIVGCRFEDGRELKLFCKYAGGVDSTGHGHRGGVEYESAVYRHVLSPLDISQAKFYGAYSDPQTGQHWLILQHLDDSLRVKKSDDPSAMRMAARWIAQFHAKSEARLAQHPMPFLKAYNADYCLGWVRRTSEFAGSLRHRYPWLATLCKASQELLSRLVTSQPTVIHGEYYPHNVLYQRGRIFPVDWESAAIAEGLIDLAALIEGWPEDVVQSCELEYCETRWPGGSPAEFRQTLSAARLYLQFRWLGDRPDWTTAEDSQWRFDDLRSLGEEFGVL